MMKSLVAAAALAAAALISTPTAGATPAEDIAYFYNLDLLGIRVTDTTLAIQTGRGICLYLDTGKSRAQAAVSLYANSSYMEVPTLNTAQRVVLASTYAYCPWHTTAAAQRAI